MDYSMLLLILLGCPVAAALLMAVLPSKTVPRAVYEVIHLVSLAGVAVAGLSLVVAVFSGSDIFSVGEWFHLDGPDCCYRAVHGVVLAALCGP